MDEIVARCPDCGMEQATEFAHCFVCMKPSRWWCSACREWRPSRFCPACGGGLGVPAELFLGAWPLGATVPFTVLVRNAGKKLVGGAVGCSDPAVLVPYPRLLVAPGDTLELNGRVTLAPGALGRRTFLLRFETPTPSETVLAVEAAEPLPRLEFFPPLVVLRTPNPGSMSRTSVARQEHRQPPAHCRPLLRRDVAGVRAEAACPAPRVGRGEASHQEQEDRLRAARGASHRLYVGGRVGSDRPLHAPRPGANGRGGRLWRTQAGAPRPSRTWWCATPAACGWTAPRSGPTRGSARCPGASTCPPGAKEDSRARLAHRRT